MGAMDGQVTGGARGIGLATARALAERGAIVYIGDLDGQLAELEAKGARLADGQALDVTSPESFSRFLEGIRDAEGRVDVLVNNAGVMPWGAFLDQDEATIAQTIAVNLEGALTGMRLALPEMRERGSGHVVNVASLAGRVYVPGSAVYSGVKAAVVAITEGVRRELRGTGVELSVILPFKVATELASGAPEGRGINSIAPEDVAAKIVAAIEGGSRTSVAGPWWADPLTRAYSLLPGRIAGLVRTLARDDRILTDLDEPERASYEARLAEAREDRDSHESR